MGDAGGGVVDWTHYELRKLRCRQSPRIGLEAMSGGPWVSGSGWRPTSLAIKPGAVSVFWTDFGDEQVDEPFFHWTVERLNRKEPPPEEEVTGLSALFEHARPLPPVNPAGLILHVSRCGSTLVARSLQRRAKVVLLGEMGAIGSLLTPGIHLTSPYSEPEWLAVQRNVLDSIIRIFAHGPGDPGPRVVLKFQSATLLHIAAVKRIWPGTPLLILVRDPLEVLLSNYLRPGGWVRAKQVPLLEKSLFGWSAGDVHAMSMLEYIARGIGEFCRSALANLDAQCAVLDYTDLNESTLDRLASLFQCDGAPRDHEDDRKYLNVYSKDRLQQQPFKADQGAVSSGATSAMMAAVARWAVEPYEALRAAEGRSLR
jgi:hypothetical protein